MLLNCNFISYYLCLLVVRLLVVRLLVVCLLVVRLLVVRLLVVRLLVVIFYFQNILKIILFSLRLLG